MDKNVALAVQIPILFMMIVTLTLIEAAGLFDYSRLEGNVLINLSAPRI